MHIFIMGKVSDGFTFGRSLEPWMIFLLLSNGFQPSLQENTGHMIKAPDIGLKTVQSSLTAV